ncbi:MAG TPA: glycosyltransferase family 9 protein [Thermoanaerobaculia bacterium]
MVTPLRDLAWIAAPGVRPPPLDAAGEPCLLVHQARFHVGDTLWLTPLLRAIHRFFPKARTTVVGPPVACELLAGNPHAAVVVPYLPDHGGEGRRRVLGRLTGRRFDAALFAFARRPESCWLARALAAGGVPWRINLEYFDPSLDHRSVPSWLTHEGWCVWGTLPSPRMLLHALDPLLGTERSAWTEDDRRVELHVSQEARRRADELLKARGIAGEPFAVLAPGGYSSRRWPAERFSHLAARLAAELGLHVLIEGSPAEEPLLAQVAAQAGTAAGRRIVAAADPLDVFAALLERARLLVANDSAPIHLAEAAGTPTLYFAQREKLVHSHPAGEACWALFDEIGNDPARITVEQALRAARAL